MPSRDPRTSGPGPSLWLQPPRAPSGPPTEDGAICRKSLQSRTPEAPVSTPQNHFLSWVRYPQIHPGVNPLNISRKHATGGVGWKVPEMMSQTGSDSQGRVMLPRGEEASVMKRS